jgi:hypothetical protein
VSQPSPDVPPYRVVYSGECREEIRHLLVQARGKGRLAEIAQAIRDAETRLAWIPLDFGEPLRDLVAMRLQVFIGTIPPLVIEYAVAEARRLVYVTRPIKLLSNSGL